MRIGILIILSLAAGLAACGKPDQPSISLFLAMQRGDIDQLDRHLEWGTEVNQAFADGDYPLHIAASNGRVVMVDLLLDAGADVSAKNKAELTALDLAILSGRTQVAKVLFKAGATIDASALLVRAASQDVTDRDTVKVLISHGANINHVDTKGDTPLLTAVRHGNHRLLQHLINHGAEVNSKDAEKKSALTIALESGENDIAKILRANGGTE